MKSYYKNKYTIIDLNLPIEYSKNQLKWLKEIEAITESEFIELIKELESQHLI
jgi:hypothetical protein